MYILFSHSSTLSWSHCFGLWSLEKTVHSVFQKTKWASETCHHQSGGMEPAKKSWTFPPKGLKLHRVDPQLLFKHYNDFMTNWSDSPRSWPTEILRMTSSSNDMRKRHICFRFDPPQQSVLDPADFSVTINKWRISIFMLTRQKWIKNIVFKTSPENKRFPLDFQQWPKITTHRYRSGRIKHTRMILIFTFKPPQLSVSL